MEKKEALGFLHHRVKRGLGEECREGCSWEEVIEVYEPNTAKSVSIMERGGEREVSSPTLQGKERTGVKRGLGADCNEGCSWEEVIEVYEPNTARSVRIMERGGGEGGVFTCITGKEDWKSYLLNWNCGPLNCPAGCYTTNHDYSHSDNLAVTCYLEDRGRVSTCLPLRKEKLKLHLTAVGTIQYEREWLEILGPTKKIPEVYTHCDRKGNPSACEIYYSDDVQITRAGDIRQGTGTCTAVDVCSGCNDGFYGGDKYCYMAVTMASMVEINTVTGTGTCTAIDVCSGCNNGFYGGDKYCYRYWYMYRVDVCSGYCNNGFYGGDKDCYSTGTCTAVDVCSGCNDGFYGGDKYCYNYCTCTAPLMFVVAVTMASMVTGTCNAVDVCSGCNDGFYGGDKHRYSKYFSTTEHTTKYRHTHRRADVCSGCNDGFYGGDKILLHNNAIYDRGTCTAVDVCSGCNDGFYGDDKHCYSGCNDGFYGGDKHCYSGVLASVTMNMQDRVLAHVLPLTFVGAVTMATMVGINTVTGTGTCTAVDDFVVAVMMASMVEINTVTGTGTCTSVDVVMAVTMASMSGDKDCYRVLVSNNVIYDRVLGTGTCTAVDVCSVCNDGFYGGDKYCYSKYFVSNNVIYDRDLVHVLLLTFVVVVTMATMGTGTCTPIDACMAVTMASMVEINTVTGTAHVPVDVCSGCNDGFYGEIKTVTGTGTCTAVDVCSGCNNGYYGGDKYCYRSGTCTAVDVCSGCNDGFYGGDKYCYMAVDKWLHYGGDKDCCGSKYFASNNVIYDRDTGTCTATVDVCCSGCNNGFYGGDKYYYMAVTMASMVEINTVTGTGTCTAVDVCSGCNDGFYGGDKYCYSKYLVSNNVIYDRVLVHVLLLTFVVAVTMASMVEINTVTGTGTCTAVDVCSGCNDGFYGGDKYCYSTGTCTAVDVCSGCNDGFYGGDKYCYRALAHVLLLTFVVAVTMASMVEINTVTGTGTCTAVDACSGCNDGFYGGDKDCYNRALAHVPLTIDENGYGGDKYCYMAVTNGFYGGINTDTGTGTCTAVDVCSGCKDASMVEINTVTGTGTCTAVDVCSGYAVASMVEINTVIGTGTCTAVDVCSGCNDEAMVGINTVTKVLAHVLLLMSVLAVMMASMVEINTVIVSTCQQQCNIRQGTGTCTLLMLVVAVMMASMVEINTVTGTGTCTAVDVCSGCNDGFYGGINTVTQVPVRKQCNIRQSTGTCTAADVCSGCNDGSYGGDKHCSQVLVHAPLLNVCSGCNDGFYGGDKYCYMAATMASMVEINTVTVSTCQQQCNIRQAPVHVLLLTFVVAVTMASMVEINTVTVSTLSATNATYLLRTGLVHVPLLTFVVAVTMASMVEINTVTVSTCQQQCNIRQGTGTCWAVDVCSGCNDGFYGGDKYCYSKHLSVTM
ncbi:unnamed protein product [Mytilus edulis]|uniref:Uncharacterized protein n=1 Tax=Mytilus edulis TaxID=6550 RepID=A0A8S3TXC5_MYTED|nr:unnamed protein product [Mytilus edulis]